MKCSLYTYILLAVFFSLNTGSILPSVIKNSAGNSADGNTVLSSRKIDSLITSDFLHLKYNFKIPGGAKVVSYKIEKATNSITIKCNDQFTNQPFRDSTVNALKDSVRGLLQKPEYHVSIVAGGYEISELIPNIFRGNAALIDAARLYRQEAKGIRQVVKNTSKPYTISAGLQNRNIVLWGSHGWYYNYKLLKWEWQRPRLFQTAEDMLTYSLCVSYLLPMLESAGANVYFPRERDVQVYEVIVDNDCPEDVTGKTYKESGKLKWITGKQNPGFAMPRKTLEDKENPFLIGTSRMFNGDTKETGTVAWIPEIKADGDYAVYIAYSAARGNTANALYKVYHSGGVTTFSVNQQIGGSSWYYLGTFHFRKGKNVSEGAVVLSNKSGSRTETISADAVRFGGGMATVKKAGAVSDKPKFAEGARYWLQYAGMPDTLIYAMNSEDDYKDDFQCRAEYGNYLHGAPFGPTKDRTAGLGIPIDAMLAIHTDAGTAGGDTIIGTSAIFSITGADANKIFPNGVSRLANRDFADIVQTEIVADIRKLFDSSWVRRGLRNAEYSESFRPNTPSVLLELLSHQNFTDCRFVQSPRFRFAIARSIYKGILKYLSNSSNESYIVQPLPPGCFSAVPNSESSIRLNWQPAVDEIDSNAVPTGYVIYRAIDYGGFDNGTYTKLTSYEVKGVEKNKIYRFRICAVNKGGESFPTEELSAGISGSESNPVLIVNGFHRLSAPDWVATDNMAGFKNTIDEGVPFKQEASYTGAQYDFSRASEFVSNDMPGFGASASDFDGKIIAGNTFNFPAVHGRAIANAGFSFGSVADETVMNSLIDLNEFDILDVIYGEEKTTYPPSASRIAETRFSLFPEKLRNKLTDFLNAGKSLFVSGAYIASDPYQQKSIDGRSDDFITGMLHFGYSGSYASKDGKVEIVHNDFKLASSQFRFNTEFNDTVYRVEAPGAIRAIGDANVFSRYTGTGLPAGVSFKGKYSVVALGFPFETIVDEYTRRELMKKILNYLK